MKKSTETDTERDTETDTETNTETDIETDAETDAETDTEKVTETDALKILVVATCSGKSNGVNDVLYYCSGRFSEEQS